MRASSKSTTETNLRFIMSRILMIVAWVTVQACGETPEDVGTVIVSVSVSPATASLSSLADTVRLTATARDANGSAIGGAQFTWSSSDSEIASVNTSGLITATGNGTATITAASGGIAGSATITVAQEVSAVAVAPATTTFVALGDVAQLSADAFDTNDNSIAGTDFAWTSSDEGVAGVNSAGMVTAVANGTTTITATAQGVAGTTEITVAQEVVSVSVTPATVTVSIPTQISATVTDANDHSVDGATLAWDSSNPLVASVDNQGIATGLEAGTTTVTLNADGVAGSAEVTVIGETTSGVIEGINTWARSNSPYVVTGNILVADGAQLTVEPGVQILFAGDYYIMVEGTFAAIGTQTDSITFTSTQPAPEPGDWGNIWFTDISVDAVVGGSGEYVSGSGFAFVEFAYGGQIQFDASAPYFANNHVHHARGSTPRSGFPGAVWACNSGTVIRDNVIEDNPITGIAASGDGTVIRNNLIRRNWGGWGGGISIFPGDCPNTGAGMVVVEDNQISDNTSRFGGGIFIYSGSPTISYNDITNNSTFGVLESRHNAQGNGAAISMYKDGQPEFTYNNIEGNSSTAEGASTAFFFGWGFVGVVNNNNISNPTTYEIFMNMEMTNDVNAESNFWNTNDSSDIAERIWDFSDDFQLGIVEFQPFLPERQSAAGRRTGG